MNAALPRKRDRSRTYDVVLFGASGFTGRLVAEYLAKHYGASDVRIALAGRDKAKIAGVQSEIAGSHPAAAKWPILVADARDEAALGSVAAQAEVVCTTVGPYARHGAGLVAACVKRGTDYCDLTGEVQFIRRMVDAHEDEARRTGARIVHCCGFDSIPSDLGALMVVDALKARGATSGIDVHFYAGESKGGFSGGTVASMINILEEVERDRSVLRVVGDPYALTPGERGSDGRDQVGVRYDADLGMWTAPFLMAAINTRVVRRSNALLDYAYGHDFRYSEAMSTGKGAKGLAMATAITAGMGAAMGALATKALRPLVQKRLPAPGEGPSKEQRDSGFFVSRLIGKGRTADGREVTARGRVEGKADPGYGETSKMLSESALCLALDGASLEAPGGIRTPASTMGTRLTERLRAAGMVFSVE